MTVEELQDFIADNVHANVDDKVVGQIMNDAATMDFNSFTKKWDEFLQEHSSGWSSARPGDKDIYTRLREAYGSSDEKNPFVVPENFSDEIYEAKFKDVPKEEYTRNLSKMKELWDTETKAREEGAGRIRRTREVDKEWSWPKKLLANEYSQARYIDDPNSTPFGKEGDFDPMDNKLELANIGLHGASLAGDAIPGGWGYLAGPGTRLVNDLVQEFGDYGKPAEDVLHDRALDLGTSFLGEAGPNMLLRQAARSEKLAKTFGPGLNNTVNYYDLIKQQKQTQKLLKAIDKESDYARKYQLIQNLPDNFAGKADLLKKFDPGVPYVNQEVAKSYGGATQILPQAEAKKRAEKALEREKEILAAKAQSKQSGKPMKPMLPPDPRMTEYYRRLATTPEPGKLGKKFARVFNWPVVDNILSLTKRKTSGYHLANPNVDKPESEKVRKVKDWYKQNYARDWEMDFKPKEDAGLLYEAWKEWDEERKGLR